MLVHNLNKLISDLCILVLQFHSQQADRPNLLQVFLFSGSRQISNTEVSLLCAAADTEVALGLQHVAVQLEDGLGGEGRCAIFSIGKAPVLATKVHHEAELPERPHRAEQGDEQVFVGVPRDVADEDLTALSWGWTVPP